MKRLLILAALLFVLPAHAEVSIDWVTVGDPGNAGDPQESCLGCGPGTTFGAVAYEYRIGKYEVTNAQYVEFLNAVAATDTYSLYESTMASAGGITRSGSPGSYTYSLIAGRESWPVNFVSFYDALRFANWLHNGQPTGAQDSTTTEDGAYTMITESYPDGPFITRNAGATVFLPSEDESYKAAYYDEGSMSYFDYPAGSDTSTTCAVPGATANTANCAAVVGDLTDVGSYTASASPNGTFDQGGNAGEWNEAIIGSQRGRRAGTYLNALLHLAASYRSGYTPASGAGTFGFRVASPASAPPVPSMSTPGVALLGGLVFGVGIMGLVIAARRRRPPTR